MAHRADKLKHASRIRIAKQRRPCAHGCAGPIMIVCIPYRDASVKWGVHFSGEHCGLANDVELADHFDVIPSRPQHGFRGHTQKH